MPESAILEQPQCFAERTGQTPWRFNRENAREMSRRGNLARWSRPDPVPKTPETIPATPANVPCPDERLSLLAEQITRTRDALNSDKLEPHHRAALLRALCELLDKERIAQGKPLPGSLKPPSAPRLKRGPSSVLVDEVQAAPVIEQPAAVVPARPLGWEYDEPSKQV